MPVLPSSHPDDAMPHTPADGSAETGAGNWPPRDRDPFDPACEPKPDRERGRTEETPREDSR